MMSWTDRNQRRWAELFFVLLIGPLCTLTLYLFCDLEGVLICLCHLIFSASEMRSFKGFSNGNRFTDFIYEDRKALSESAHFISETVFLGHFTHLNKSHSETAWVCCVRWNDCVEALAQFNMLRSLHVCVCACGELETCVSSANLCWQSIWEKSDFSLSLPHSISLSHTHTVTEHYDLALCLIALIRAITKPSSSQLGSTEWL